MMKKILTLFLALAVSVGTLFAQSGTCGDNLTWTLDTESGTLTISGTGAMTDYSWISAPWYSYRESIKTVKIGSSVTSIGNNAFSLCESLTSIIIPSSVTSIGEYAFHDCSSLTSVTIPNSVTSIGNNAFSLCESLTFITIPNSVTSIGNNAFYNCSSLTSVTIGNSVTSIERETFEYCSSLTSVTIPNSVKIIGDQAFWECSKLTSITIPNSVTRIGYWAFRLVPNIVYNGIATGSPWGARSINGFVEGYLVYSDETKTKLLACSAAAKGEIIIPNSVTSIEDGAFYGCSSLTSITIPNSVTSIGGYAFYNCSGLTSVTIPNGVTSIGTYTFYNCSSLTSITIPNSVTSIGGSAFRDCSGLTSIIVPNSVTSIGEDAFWDCSSLKNVSIASSVKVLEDSAFYNCTNIETITCYGMRPPTVNTNALYGLSYSTIVYVPADYLETYQMHEQWGLYDVRALENSGTEPETYTVTWQDEDGNVIKTDEVKQGTTPAFTGTTPTKEGYTFVGWLPNIKPATEDTKYTTYFIPTQQQESKVYTVNINGENCSLNINNQYPEGTVITLEAVADECFEFRQWSDGNKENPRTITVTANTNLTAEFNKVRYTVTGEPSTGGKVQIRKQ